jgi:hypothetical protein
MPFATISLDLHYRRRCCLRCRGGLYQRFGAAALPETPHSQRSQLPPALIAVLLAR